MIEINSYFCGAGLMDVGLKESGIDIKQAWEIDDDPYYKLYEGK